jgi:hypothetical protein
MAEKKVKQTFNTRLHECCHDDELKPITQCVHFSGGWAYAYNGIVAIKQILAFQSVQNMDKLDGNSLHKDSYKAAMGFEIVTATDEGIHCVNENGQSAFFDYFEFKANETQPNIDKLFENMKGQKQVSFIGFNPEQFLKLSKALYAPSGNIRCQFTGVDSAILVDVIGVDEQEALIMPVILNDTLF